MDINVIIHQARQKLPEIEKYPLDEVQIPIEKEDDFVIWNPVIDSSVYIIKFKKSLNDSDDLFWEYCHTIQ